MIERFRTSFLVIIQGAGNLVSFRSTMMLPTEMFGLEFRYDNHLRRSVNLMTEMAKNFAPADWICRRLSGEDASCYRTVLLEGLQAHPEAFVASAEDEAFLSVDDFARRLDAKENAIFGVFAGNELAAIATFHRPPLRKRAHAGMILGMYVRSEHGRSGMGKTLLRYVLAFAEQHVDQVELCVNVANERARNLYIGFGFESNGVKS